MKIQTYSNEIFYIKLYLFHQVYKSNSKRKAHIIKSHPGAKIPSNSERVGISLAVHNFQENTFQILIFVSEQGAVLNDPYAKHVKDVILDPFNCDYCYRQYASRAKLLSHHRRDHADLLPSDMKVRYYNVIIEESA